MSEQWKSECLRWRGRVLTGQYAHLCQDWDGLPIDETCIEWPCACASEMSEPEKVEQVAIALYRADRDLDAADMTWETWCGHFPKAAGLVRKSARAAIEAMREPSEEMVEAAVAPYRDKNTAEFDALFRKTVAGYWRAMIDKALTGGSK